MRTACMFLKVLIYKITIATKSPHPTAGSGPACCAAGFVIAMESAALARMSHFYSTGVVLLGKCDIADTTSQRLPLWKRIDTCISAPEYNFNNHPLAVTRRF